MFLFRIIFALIILLSTGNISLAKEYISLKLQNIPPQTATLFIPIESLPENATIESSNSIDKLLKGYIYSANRDSKTKQINSIEIISTGQKHLPSSIELDFVVNNDNIDIQILDSIYNIEPIYIQGANIRVNNIYLEANECNIEEKRKINYIKSINRNISQKEKNSKEDPCPQKARLKTITFELDFGNINQEKINTVYIPFVLDNNELLTDIISLDDDEQTILYNDGVLEISNLNREISARNNIKFKIEFTDNGQSALNVNIGKPLLNKAKKIEQIKLTIDKNSNE